MAEEGRGQRHSAPKVAPVTGQPFLRVLTTLRVVQNVKKAIAWSSRAQPSFGFHQNSPVKNFRTAKIFSSLPHFCQQKFFRFQRKNSAKRSAPCTLDSVPSRSVDTDRWACWQDFFRTAKKSWSADCQPPSHKKACNCSIWLCSIFYTCVCSVSYTFSEIV